MQHQEQIILSVWVKIGRLAGLHSDSMASKCVEDVGGPREVEYHLAWARVRHTFHLQCRSFNDGYMTMHFVIHA